MKNLAQQVKMVQEEPCKSLQKQGLSTKQEGDDYPYPGLKEALNESSKVLIRTQLQEEHGESSPVSLLPEEIFQNRKIQQ